jgi:hypothetical protein
MEVKELVTQLMAMKDLVREDDDARKAFVQDPVKFTMEHANLDFRDLGIDPSELSVGINQSRQLSKAADAQEVAIAVCAVVV